MSSLLAKEKKFVKEFKKLKKFIQVWKVNKINFFKNLKKKIIKKVCKAFPGRASILINYLGINYKNIPIIFEQNNSPKVYKFVPGTKIKILPDKLIKKQIKNLIINF